MVKQRKNSRSLKWTWSDARFEREKARQSLFENQKRPLRYKRARIYSAQLGRFISRDPLEFVDGMNLYRAYFVPGGVDPFGLDLYLPEDGGFTPEPQVCDYGIVGDLFGLNPLPPLDIGPCRPPTGTGKLYDQIYDKLRFICDNCCKCDSSDCIADARRIALAVKNTWENGWTWDAGPVGDLMLWLRTGYKDQKHWGRLCFEWSYGFELAIKSSVKSDCFSVELEEASTFDGSGRVHSWVKVTSKCGQSVLIDDGFWKRGIFCHWDRPCSPKCTRCENWGGMGCTAARPGECYCYRGTNLSTTVEGCNPAEAYSHNCQHVPRR